MTNIPNSADSSDKITQCKLEINTNICTDCIFILKILQLGKFYRVATVSYTQNSLTQNLIFFRKTIEKDYDTKEKKIHTLSLLVVFYLITEHSRTKKMDYVDKIALSNLSYTTRLQTSVTIVYF